MRHVTKATSVIYAVLLTLLILCASVARADADCVNAVSLPEVVRKTMQFYFNPAAAHVRSLDELIKTLPAAAQYNKPAGVFVTLSSNGKPRACWGSVFPQHRNLVAATAYATMGALSKDYRYRQIRGAEWRSLKPQVTVIRAVEPIDGIRGQNPLIYGLFIRSGSKTGVLLPGEARDPNFQLVKCKLKAGIHDNEPFQLYRIKADIYE